jgi:DnaK suppressor protein
MFTQQAISSHLQSDQIETIKQMISEEIDRLEETLHFKRNGLDEELLNAKDEVDSANNSILLAQGLRFASRESLYLKKLKKSLIKIVKGEYGQCDDCGSDISYNRLLARPTSELCIHCKEESEREEFQNAVGRVSKSLGQEFNPSRK